MEKVKKKIGRPASVDKAEAVSIYVRGSVIKEHSGKDCYRKKLKRLSEEHLEGGLDGKGK